MFSGVFGEGGLLVRLHEVGSHLKFLVHLSKSRLHLVLDDVDNAYLDILLL